MRITRAHKLFLLTDMKTTQRYCGPKTIGTLLLALALSQPIATRAAATGQTFATPEEAVSALVQATSAKSGKDLRAIFGSAAAELQNPDRV